MCILNVLHMLPYCAEKLGKRGQLGQNYLVHEIHIVS